MVPRRIPSGLRRFVPLVAVAATAVTAPLAPLPADARDYTFHILAHVPTRCTVHRASHDIVLIHTADDADGASQVLRGDGGFRIACNVPYAFEFRHITRRSARGRLGPIAAAPAAGDAPLPLPFDLAVSMPGRDGPLEGRCSAAELAIDATGCMPVSAPDDPRLGAPLGRVQLALVADTGTVLRDHPIITTSDAPPPPAARDAGSTGLRISVQPRH